jgi:EAL domain-containing protein (putative c-di-GMP-specific phosphodiesterase class I)
VLREACAQAARWPEHIHIAVNLSAVQFKNANLPGTVISALASSGLAANRLELEITESVLLNDSEATLATLHQLRNLGVSISMDDFGTGYSSLSYLRKFPFDKIKIERCHPTVLPATAAGLPLLQRRPPQAPKRLAMTARSTPNYKRPARLADKPAWR